MLLWHLNETASLQQMAGDLMLCRDLAQGWTLLPAERLRLRTAAVKRTADQGRAGVGQFGSEARRVGAVAVEPWNRLQQCLGVGMPRGEEQRLAAGAGFAPRVPRYITATRSAMWLHHGKVVARSRGRSRPRSARSSQQQVDAPAPAPTRSSARDRLIPDRPVRACSASARAMPMRCRCPPLRAGAGSAAPPRRCRGRPDGQQARRRCSPTVRWHRRVRWMLEAARLSSWPPIRHARG
jgi:hypothetical protein